MPNVGSKKHLQPKKDRVTNALEYARGFAASCGGKDTALVKAKSLEDAARKAGIPDVDTANFWANIAGHLGKLLFVLFFLNGCNYVLHPYFKVGDCIIQETNENFFTGKKQIEVLKVTAIGVKTYQFKILRMDRYPNLTGDSIIYEDISFGFFDTQFSKTTCLSGD